MDAGPSRIKLFESRWLEQQTTISAPAFIALWAMVLPFIAYSALGTARWTTAMGLVIAGTVAWTLTEYGLHRYLFHWRANSRLMKRLVYILHGNHHSVPDDPGRNLMPPIVSLPVGGVIWTMMLSMLGPRGGWLFLGFITGYVIYDLLHYACHQKTMTGPLLRKFKTHHLRHHYSRKHGNYAITAIIWDSLFRTNLRRGKRRYLANGQSC